MQAIRSADQAVDSHIAYMDELEKLRDAESSSHVLAKEAERRARVSDARLVTAENAAHCAQQEASAAHERAQLAEAAAEAARAELDLRQGGAGTQSWVDRAHDTLLAAVLGQRSWW